MGGVWDWVDKSAPTSVNRPLFTELSLPHTPNATSEAAGQQPRRPQRTPPRLPVACAGRWITQRVQGDTACVAKR